MEGVILSPYRPYQESLESAFRRVFRQLDLPWIDRKNRTTTTVLALFIGWLGYTTFISVTDAEACTTWGFSGRLFLYFWLGLMGSG
jgi:hypothetical protein